jgi:hypothetical protein
MHPNVIPQVFDALPAALPADVVCCVLPGQGAGFGLGVIAKRTGSRFAPVVLRVTGEAKVYLAALRDVAGRIHGWYELHVQLAPSDAAGPGGEAMSNAQSDRAWLERASRWQGTSCAMAAVAIGYESKPGPVLVLDEMGNLVSHVKDRNRRWAVCTDEEVLEKAGLGGYAGGIERYIWDVAADGRGDPSTLTLASTTSEDVVKALGAASADQVVTLGGRWMVMPLAGLSLEQWLEVLEATGKASDGREGKENGEAAAAITAQRLAKSGPILVSRRAGSQGLAELFAAKLAVWASCVSQVTQEVAVGQKPMLAVCPRMFAVRVGQRRGVPLAWQSEVVLTEGSAAREVKTQASGLALFVPAHQVSQALYTPHASSGGSGGGQVTRWGKLSLRSVKADGGLVTLEATLTSEERLPPARDSIWVRFASGSQTLSLIGSVDTKGALAGNQVRFRTRQTKLSSEVVGELEQLAGVPIEAEFRLLNPQTVACDMHGLAVLGARIFLKNGRLSLPEAMDSLRNLAAEVGETKDDTVKLATRVAAVVAGDERWMNELGPQHVAGGSLDWQVAMGQIGQERWCGLLAALVRMLPAAGPESLCKHLSDVPAGRPSEPLEEMDRQVRALADQAMLAVFGDSVADTELAEILRKAMERV